MVSRLTIPRSNDYAQIRSLTELTLRGQVVRPDGAIIDDLPKLPIERPKVGGPWIHSTGIRELQRLTNLRSLTLNCQRLTDDGVEALNKLHGLESLTLDPVFVNKISLHGLDRLKLLLLDSRPNSISVELRDLPALEQLTVIGLDDVKEPQQLELRGVTNLIVLYTSNVTLDDPSWQEIHGSKRLVILHSDRFETDKYGIWQLRGFPFVSDVEICNSLAAQLEVSEMPALERLRFSYNPAAKGLRFDKLPSLREVLLEGNSKLKDILFVGTPNLQTIGLQFIDERSEDGSGPQQISIPGLATLTKLERIDTDRVPLTAESLRDLGQLTNLSSLTLRAKEFDDLGLAGLKGLVGLTELSLDGTSVSDSGLSVIAGLKNLETLDLVATKVSAAAIAALQQQFPKLQIEW